MSNMGTTDEMCRLVLDSIVGNVDQTEEPPKIIEPSPSTQKVDHPWKQYEHNFKLTDIQTVHTDNIPSNGPTTHTYSDLNIVDDIECCVRGCSSTGITTDTDFFFFPKPKSRMVTVINEHGVAEEMSRLAAWRKAIKYRKIDKRHPKKSSVINLRVCSKHFCQSDFKNTKYSVPILKTTAVPSLFLGATSKSKLLAPKVDPITKLIGDINDDIIADVPDLINIVNVFSEKIQEPAPKVKEEPMDIEIEEILIKEEDIVDALPAPELPIRMKTPELVPISKTPQPEVPTMIQTPLPQLPNNIKTTAPEPTKIYTRCAVCLSNEWENHLFHNIYDFQFQYNGMSILEMLELCTGYKMDRQRPLAQCICDICYQELLVRNIYREKFIKSQNILKSERKQ